MRTIILTPLIGLFLLLALILPHKSVYAEKNENLIQMAILLDTSGSMQGLIDQAKSQLWKIVNELALAKKEGKTPKLEVALYEYGKSTIPANEGYLRMIVPLTTDLDQVSEELFKLRTNGGDEYCGTVIKAATEGLKWSERKNVLKVIFIAGNEPFTQGGVDYKKSCKNAISKGIMINTIYCGNYEEGIRTNWKDGADLADGKYIHIDHNRKKVHIKAPQDAEIIRLGKELNRTYISYGSSGKKMKKRQARQDVNAESFAPEIMVQRSVTKSSAQYDSSGWDIVDAEKSGKKVEEMKDEELPENMRKMSKKERTEYIKKMKKTREELQAKIKKLNEERRKYIDKKKKKSADNDSLDSAIIKSIREQAVKKQFKFK